MPSARLQTIVNDLLAPEMKRLDEMLERVVQQHRNAGGSVDGFQYKGTYYRIVNALTPLTQLHRGLEEEMEFYLLLHDKVSSDVAGIIQGFSPAVTRCQDTQDLRDVLPEFLVSLDAGLKRLRRTREPAFTVADAPHKVAQFNKAEELAAYFMANRILY